MSKMKPHHPHQGAANTNANLKNDVGRGSHGLVQGPQPQRKAQSVDPRDRAAASFAPSGGHGPNQNSRNAPANASAHGAAYAQQQQHPSFGQNSN